MMIAPDQPMTGLSTSLSGGMALLQLLSEKILLGLLPYSYPRIFKDCSLTSEIIVPLETA